MGTRNSRPNAASQSGVHAFQPCPTPGEANAWRAMCARRGAFRAKRGESAKPPTKPPVWIATDLLHGNTACRPRSRTNSEETPPAVTRSAGARCNANVGTLAEGSRAAGGGQCVRHILIQRGGKCKGVVRKECGMERQACQKGGVRGGVRGGKRRAHGKEGAKGVSMRVPKGGHGRVAVMQMGAVWCGQ